MKMNKKSGMHRKISFILVFLTAFSCSVFAADDRKSGVLPDPEKTDPRALGIMAGFPPSPDKIVRFDDASLFQYPNIRWAFNHMRELIPTANVSRGQGPVFRLPRAERNIDGVSFTAMTGETMTWAEAVKKTYSDGILVLHKGRVVYEKYFGEGDPHRPHVAMSVTKSIVGLLAARLVAEGSIDPEALVIKYVPELRNTAFGDATVRQVMDMTTGVKYSENYADPKADVWNYARAGNMMPRGKDYAGPNTFYEFLLGVKKEGEHGEAFAYKTVNAEVLAWIIRRVTGKSLAEVLSAAIWSKIGAESDAYFQVDGIGTEQGGGGLNTTLRDLARLGEMLRNNGYFNGKQILPASVVEDIRAGADKAKFVKAGYKTLPGFSYRNMWWVSHNDHGVFMARGIHGQGIYIDPKAEMVIVRYASHPVAPNAFNDPITLPAYMAVAKALMQ
jgi:CubicO group peptidase (beta-lactamase class C family)